MTMPELMNCPHSGDGWCLSCVQKAIYSDTNYAKVNTPLSGDGALWSLATVIHGEHEGKIVCIMCCFSDGQCIVSFGVGEDDEEEIYGIIDIKDLRTWIRVKSVYNIGGHTFYEKVDN